ncbi:MAG: CocE/NonD family hydrolase [Acidimicrobiales bacterium]
MAPTRALVRVGVVAGLAAAALVATTAAGAASTGTAPGPAATAAWSPQPAAYGEGSHLNEPVTMSDGTVLRADVYYPTDPSTGAPAPGTFPVLLQQTPYGKQNVAQQGALANTDVAYLVERGYLVVIADVRGTGSSGGTWGLFDPVQATDGATLVDWASHLPGSDGKVGLFGESYMGINQFLTVSAMPEHSPVKAMFPIVSGNDLYRDTVTQGGLLDAEFSAFYLSLVAGLNAANPVADPLQELAAGPGPGTGPLGSPGSTAVDALVEELQHDAALLSYDGPSVADIETGGSEAYDGASWAARNPVHALADVVRDRIPAFLVGGWHDLFQRGELLNYTGLQNLADGRPVLAPMAPGQPVTPRYQLLMGPWTHLTTGSGIDLAELELEWFDTWLLGQATPLRSTPTPLHLDLLGTGRYVDTTTWPLPQAPATPLYFGPGPSGSLGAALNDGTLTPTPPTAPTGADPVVFTGLSSACDVQTDQWSAGLLAAASSAAGVANPCDANDVTLGAGPGSLTYTSAPVPAEEVIGGPVDVTVDATSTTTDTELVATLEEVSPSGQSVPLTSGALLGSLRAEDPTATWTGGDGQPLLPYHPYTAASQRRVVPGKITRYDIEVFPTFADVPAGWRIRVTISTSDTPHLFPTLAQLPHLVGGVYDVQRNAAAASFVNLPLAPVGAFPTACTDACPPA